MNERTLHVALGSIHGETMLAQSALPAVFQVRNSAVIGANNFFGLEIIFDKNFRRVALALLLTAGSFIGMAS